MFFFSYKRPSDRSIIRRILPKTLSASLSAYYLLPSCPNPPKERRLWLRQRLFRQWNQRRQRRARSSSLSGPAQWIKLHFMVWRREEKDKNDAGTKYNHASKVCVPTSLQSVKATAKQGGGVNTTKLALVAVPKDVLRTTTAAAAAPPPHVTDSCAAHCYSWHLLDSTQLPSCSFSSVSSCRKMQSGIPPGGRLLFHLKHSLPRYSCSEIFDGRAHTDNQSGANVYNASYCQDWDGG